MFTMTSTSDALGDRSYVNIEMAIKNSEELTLTQMLAYFMQMMFKCGYLPESWDDVIDNINDWRADDPKDWATNFAYDATD